MSPVSEVDVVLPEPVEVGGPPSDVSSALELGADPVSPPESAVEVWSVVLESSPAVPTLPVPAGSEIWSGAKHADRSAVAHAMVILDIRGL